MLQLKTSGAAIDARSARPKQCSLAQANDELGEQEILREISSALRSIQYGSILLTIHEGRLVEFSKTVKSRINSK